MKEIKVYDIDGKEYLATRVVSLNGKKYQELCSADILRPDILYAENIDKLNLVEDWETYYALRKKYAIDERSLHGEIIVCLKGLEVDEVKISLDEVNDNLAILFESDVEEFSENGAKAFCHILAKHGITDAKKWFEEKMREVKEPGKAPYYCTDVNGFTGEAVHLQCGTIEFSSLVAINNKFTRAHEMAHKITAALTEMIINNQNYSVGRCGFLISDVTVVNEQAGIYEEKHCIGDENGRALNEGVTNLIAEKLADMKRTVTSVYYYETFIARMLAENVGEDVLFESALFNPRILENKWNALTGDKYSFAKLIYMLDARYYYDKDFRNFKAIKVARFFEKWQVRGLKKYMSVKSKARYIVMKNRFRIKTKLSYLFPKLYFRYLLYRRKYYKQLPIKHADIFCNDTMKTAVERKESRRLMLQSVSGEHQIVETERKGAQHSRWQ